MLVSKPIPGGGAPFGIDLEAGVAKIVVRRPAPEPEPAGAEVGADPADPAELDPDEDGQPAS